MKSLTRSQVCAFVWCMTCGYCEKLRKIEKKHLSCLYLSFSFSPFAAEDDNTETEEMHTTDKNEGNEVKLLEDSADQRSAQPVTTANEEPVITSNGVDSADQRGAQPATTANEEPVIADQRGAQPGTTAEEEPVLTCNEEEDSADQRGAQPITTDHDQQSDANETTMDEVPPPHKNSAQQASDANDSKSDSVCCEYKEGENLREVPLLITQYSHIQEMQKRMEKLERQLQEKEEDANKTTPRYVGKGYQHHTKYTRPCRGVCVHSRCV